MPTSQINSKQGSMPKNCARVVFRHGWLAIIYFFIMSGFVAHVYAQSSEDKLIIVNSREGVTTSYWWMPRTNASHTVLLLSGGGGGIGLNEGKPQSNNFLIRSRDYFAQAGFNVALLGNASDMRALNPSLRISPAHLADIQAVVQHLKTQSPLPLWLIGTSQGTISATAFAIQNSAALAGIVLSASYTAAREAGAITRQSVEKITLPVLFSHHKQDACRVTQLFQVERVLSDFKNAPIKKLIVSDGAGSPSGNECEALHYHGYIGIEQEVVSKISAWIKQPTP